MKKSLVILPLFIFSVVFGDLYMHNPRGSNGRLNEANENRNNGARLMDTQNNAKGGYCWGPSMSFYEGSLLSIEWTNQHGCGENTKLKCNLVIQYMCTAKDAPELARVRDGTTTDTIPDNAAGAVTKNANGELLYGMHESFQSYQDCKKRDRNLGLFVADRAKVGGLTPNGRPSAIFTRQNNNGNRNGLECTEERDYYPYWHPSEWRDIAIVTGNTEWCDFYQSESQNVKAKNYCQDKATGNGAQWNNEAACNVNGGAWTQVDSWGISAPACVKAPFQRNNHLGNTVNGQQSHFNWTLPTSSDLDCIAGDNCNCVVRMRYNISVGDLGEDGNRPDAGFIDYASNAEASPVLNDAIMYQDGAAHQLALDTTQYGRTFEDRSHVFHIKPRPDGVLPTNRIFNLNVRGKRGNIVQTYPATEYDFVPSYLFAKVGDYIHFQWTGCDTNPAGNAGEGTDQTDRSNIVQMEAMDRDQPAKDEWIADHTPLFESQELRLRMAMLGQTNCLTYEQLKQKTGNNQNAIETDVQNCMKLNAAPAYFDGGLIPMNLTGTFYYMSSRNNNFTNREQKGIIEVIPLLPTWAVVIVVLGAALFVGSAGIAGAMLYAKSHPHSQVANWFSRV